MIARDIMTTEVTTFPPDYQVGEAMKKMAEKRLQACPIVDASGRLTGVLTIVALLSKVMPPYIVSGELSNVCFAPDLEKIHEQLMKWRAQPVSNLMIANTPRARPESSVLECGAVLLNMSPNVHLLPVIGKADRLMGVITPWDLIKEIAQFK